MRYKPGRSFLKSIREIRPFFNKNAVLHTKDHTQLSRRIETAALGPATTELVGYEKKPETKTEPLQFTIISRALDRWRRSSTSKEALLIGQRNCLKDATKLTESSSAAPIPLELNSHGATASQEEVSLLTPYSASIRRQSKLAAESLSRQPLARRIPDQVSANFSGASCTFQSGKAILKYSTPDQRVPIKRHELTNSTPTTGEASLIPRHNRISGLSLPVHAHKMHSHISFLTTPTADTPGTALMLHFDNKRYLIGNMHEGLQRACIQRGQKLIKISDIFLTGKTEWRTTGGLIGMVLTLADASTQSVLSAKEKLNAKINRRAELQIQAGNVDTQSQTNADKKKALYLEQQQPSLTIHGGPNITHTLATARRFVFRKGMPVEVNEYTEDLDNKSSDHNWEPTWVDPRIQVWAMTISPSAVRKTSPPPNSKSPMKRDYDDFSKDRDQVAWHDLMTSSDDLTDQEICKSIVTEMFASAWRAGHLEEVPIEDVKLPATLFTRDADSGYLVRYNGPLPGGKEPLPTIKVLMRRPWPGALINSLPCTKASPVSTSYIIRNHKQRGKFLTAKAKQLKVQQGPLWNQLASGCSVESMDGAIIEPEMVLEEGSEGAGVAVVDLPTTEYVENLVNRPEWKVPRVMEGVIAIIWILGPGVGENEIFREFIHKHPQYQHIVSSQDSCHNYLSMDSSANAAIRLNQVDPLHFPVPVHQNTNVSQAEHPPVDTGLPHGCIKAQRGYKVHIGPRFRFDSADVVPDLDTAATLRDIPPDALQLAQFAREEIDLGSIASAAAEENLPSQNAEIICLGTGSALPSKYRNVSATLVRVPGYGSYLLDCGENTLGQLKRVFTPSELAEVFHDLKLIWISHLHADHHLGTVSVIKAWYEEVHGKQGSEDRYGEHSGAQQGGMDTLQRLRHGNNLFIACDWSMIKFLKEYSSVEDYGYDQLITLDCHPVEASSAFSRINWGDQTVDFFTDPEVTKALTAATGLSNLVACAVSHCLGAMAVTLTFPNGFKVSYSGDCRPSHKFAEIGRNSTVLIHEATFDDELLEDAEAKKHSTTSEAIGVAVAMRASRLILTHFSQRYQKLPNMEGVLNAEVKFEETEDSQDVIDEMDEVTRSTDALIAAAERMDSNIDANDKANIEDLRDSDSTIPNTMTDQQAFGNLKIGVAFDYMRVKVGEIAQLEKFNPAFAKLFEDPVVETNDGNSTIESKEPSERNESENGPSSDTRTSEKAARRKLNKQAFKAARNQRRLSFTKEKVPVADQDSVAESAPLCRNAERAERDMAVLSQLGREQAILAQSRKQGREWETQGLQERQTEVAADGAQPEALAAQQSSS